jgi:hypothetical protein
MTAISTGAVRGQVPEREAQRAEQELLAGSPRRANLNDHETARSSCEPIRRLDDVKLRWFRSGRRDIGRASPCQPALWPSDRKGHPIAVDPRTHDHRPVVAEGG